MFYYTTVITFLMACACVCVCVCVSLHGQVDPPQGCNRIKANLCVCVCLCESEIIYSRGFDVSVYERKEVCVCVCVHCDPV